MSETAALSSDYKNAAFPWSIFCRRRPSRSCLPVVPIGIICTDVHIHFRHNRLIHFNMLATARKLCLNKSRWVRFAPTVSLNVRHARFDTPFKPAYSRVSWLDLFLDCPMPQPAICPLFRAENETVAFGPGQPPHFQATST